MLREDEGRSVAKAKEELFTTRNNPIIKYYYFIFCLEWVVCCLLLPGRECGIYVVACLLARLMTRLLFVGVEGTKS